MPLLMMKVLLLLLLLLQLVYLSELVASTSSKSYHLYKKVTPHPTDSGISNLALTLEEFSKWKLWKVAHARVYKKHTNEIHRLSIWLSNMRYVENHNKQAHLLGFKLKLNSFGDLSLEEWTKNYTCHKIDTFNKDFEPDVLNQFKPPSGWDSNSPPYSIDWRSKNAVTSIKDQEEYRCHSCYAFAGVDALEGAYSLHTGLLTSLSAQQIIDCSSRYANAGCQGGSYRFSWNYIIHNGGVDKASYYPYKPKEESSCRYKKKYVGATMSSYSTIQHGNETDLQAAVGFSGPVAITFDHSQRSFQFYSGGIYKESQCSSSPYNATHEMIVVGYGMSNSGKRYWIVKNSYGTSWGASGYMYLHRGSNMCGIASNAAIPIV